MRRLLINTAFPDELRIAQIERGHLRNLEVEDLSRSRLQNSLYKARVTDISASLEAAFVDFGEERNGFLPAKNIAEEYYSHLQGSSHGIQDALNTGDEIIVQVKVDKSEHENKGALLTTIVSLPGSYLVLYPNSPEMKTVPRSLSNEGRNDAHALLERLRLPEGMGVILRTQGLRQDLSVLQEELDLLANLWTQLRAASGEHRAPVLLLHEPATLFRTLRDYLDERMDEIIVDAPEVHRAVQAWVQNFKPSYAGQVILYDEPIPLFTRYQVEDDAQSVYERRVPLASGGSLIIDHTEAMTTIDVNSGAASGRDMEDTAMRSNVEAVSEIARQLRLRDIGGQIVIDFIDMKSEENRKQVNKRLQDALRVDSARPNVGEISDFGLLSMTRKRLRPSVEEAYTEACPHCEGWGRQRTGKSLAMSILRQLEVQAAKPEISEVLLLVPARLGNFLFNEYRRSLLGIERRFDVSIVVIPSAHMADSHYKIQCHAKRSAKLDAAAYVRAERPTAEDELRGTARKRQRRAGARRRPLLEHPHEQNTSDSGAAPLPRRRSLFSFLAGAPSNEDAEAHPRRAEHRRAPAPEPRSAVGTLLHRLFGNKEDKAEQPAIDDRRRSRGTGRRPPRNGQTGEEGGQQRSRPRRQRSRNRSDRGTREGGSREGGSREGGGTRRRPQRGNAPTRPPRPLHSENVGGAGENRPRSQSTFQGRPPAPAAPQGRPAPAPQGRPSAPAAPQRRPSAPAAPQRRPSAPAAPQGRPPAPPAPQGRPPAPAAPQERPSASAAPQGRPSAPAAPRQDTPDSSEARKVRDNFYLRRQHRSADERTPGQAPSPRRQAQENSPSAQAAKRAPAGELRPHPVQEKRTEAQSARTPAATDNSVSKPPQRNEAPPMSAAQRAPNDPRGPKQ